MHIRMVEPEALTPSLRQTWEQASDGGRKFIGAVANAPEHAERLFPAYNGLRYGTRLGPRMCELLRLAIARTTQCPICLRGRRDDATDEGLTESMVAELMDPSRSPATLLGSFSPAEAAVVSFAWKFGADHFDLGEADFAALRDHFDVEEITEIGMLCAQFLGFGRFVMVFGLDDPACPVSPPPARATSGS
ncbi:carboxymuconolactone decarboxylase family protein [Nakamurella leprariae]|uniref:Carboxymuconolactone decarboxylase family protein n=1 Tax=Nakamurella leprariae TaxID=2803911 RepID=A0A939C354_9ACTN|nr:carboxymuconolactone decarboxylase family protein [Nakamurella leprariae]MBM9468762.1 carboxymuconolactone decarboxylase family protein [Nakamurella leprariae]